MDSSIASSVAIFAVGAIVILAAGTKLPVLGKAAARRFGISDTALGLFVLAAITSLPELAVTLSAMIGQKAPDLALGNILGSNNFNLAVLAFLPLTLAGRAFMSSVDAGRYSRAAILLLGFSALAGAGVMFGARMGSVAPVFLFSLPIVAVFVREVLAGGRGVVLDDEAAAEAEADRTEVVSSPVLRFTFAGVLVVVAGALVSWAGKRIADYPFGESLRLGETLVGTILMAVATSLPEVTVAFAAVRRARSPDLAVGTILGSNSFNFLVFAVGAPFLMLGTTPSVSAWSNLSSVNLVNVAAALALTALVLGAMRSQRPVGVSRAFMAFLVPVYLAGLYCVWALGAC